MGMTGAMSSAASGNMMAATAGMFAVSSVSNAYSQAQAMRAKGAYDESVAETNAKVAEVEGQQTLEAGDIAAGRKNSQTQQMVGAMRAAQAASGTDVSSGSNALTRISANTAGAMDELTIRTNAARQAWGFKTQAIQDTYAGQFSHMTASNEAAQTLLSGGMQAVEGPLSIYANYARWSRYMGGTGGPGGVPFDMSTK